MARFELWHLQIMGCSAQLACVRVFLVCLGGFVCARVCCGISYVTLSVSKYTRIMVILARTMLIQRLEPWPLPGGVTYSIVPRESR